MTISALIDNDNATLQIITILLYTMNCTVYCSRHWGEEICSGGSRRPSNRFPYIIKLKASIHHLILSLALYTYYLRQMSCVILFVWTLPSCEEREAREKSKMKIYESRSI